MRVAILLAVESFEHFFGDQLGLTPDEYVAGYRNDWAWDWCEALRRDGVESVVYVPSLRERGLRPTSDGFAVRFVPLGRAYEPWVRAPVLKRSPLGRYAAQAAGTAAMLRPLRAALGADRADALLVQEYLTARFDLLPGRVGVPVVGVEQGMRDKREVKWLKRRSLPRAATVLVQTRYQADKVRRYGGRAEHLPNGVDTAFFAPDQAVSPDPATIVCAARLHDTQKRISDLIRAVAELGAPWRLSLLGRGPDEQDFRALAASLGVADRVEFAGFIDDKAEVRERLRRATVFALPSRFEGLPVALLEAMSCGAPAVGTSIPAIAEVIEDGVSGRLVPLADPSALAAAIAEVAGDRPRYSAAARERVERSFSLDRLGRDLHAVLRGATRAH